MSENLKEKTIPELLGDLSSMVTRDQHPLMDNSHQFNHRIAQKILRELNGKFHALKKDESACDWVRVFDLNFNIGCVGTTGKRGFGLFKPDSIMPETKWDFTYCPYCGRKINLIESPKTEESDAEGEDE